MPAGEGTTVTGSAAYKRLEPRIRTRLTATSRSRDAFKLYLCIGSIRLKLTTEGLVCLCTYKYARAGNNSQEQFLGLNRS